MKKLLVTDLDDTLYNWTDFFVPSFYAMVDEVVRITGLDKAMLLEQYRERHQHFGSVEFPYITLKLPAVLEKYPNYSETELKEVFQSAFQCFNTVRDQNLKLFDGVSETLKSIRDRGVTIVGFTESSQENGFYRIMRLGIAPYFTHVYTLESKFQGDFSLDPKVRTISSKKPNPELLLDICRREGFSTEETIYMGDSPTKDVYMAHRAGITSVWANYPTAHKEYASMLLAITSWKPEEYQREVRLREEMASQGIYPDYTVHAYPELLNILTGC